MNTIKKTNRVVKHNKAEVKPELTTDGRLAIPPPPSNNQLNTKIEHDRSWLNKELNKQINLIKEDNSICTKPELFQHFKYSSHQFGAWASRYSLTPSVSDSLKKRDELLEARLVQRGWGRGNPAFVIFLLKNNHGYVDNREIDTNHHVTFNVNRGLPSPLNRKKVLSTVSKLKP